MKCILMHKRIAVAEMELDNATGFVKKIGKVYAPEHFPVGIPVKKGVADRTALNEWWTDRSIPASRSGIREALETLEITSTKLLLVRCYGLSLSDQYWICPKGSGLTWDAINFFDNGFSDYRLKYYPEMKNLKHPFSFPLRTGRRQYRLKNHCQKS